MSTTSNGKTWCWFSKNANECDYDGLHVNYRTEQHDEVMDIQASEKLNMNQPNESNTQPTQTGRLRLNDVIKDILASSDLQATTTVIQNLG